LQIATTHKNTDFDALAATIAATLIYPEAKPVLPRSLNPNTKAFLSIHKNLFDFYHPADIDLEKVERLIVLDTNCWERLDGLGGLQTRPEVEILLWDHHVNSGNINANWQCQEPVGATMTLLVRQLKEQRKMMTPIQATLFLAGIYEDTGHLSYPSSTAEDAYAAAYLLERGADLNMLSNFLRPTYSQKQKDMLFLMMQQAERTKINGYNISINSQTVDGHVGGLAVVVDMYQDIMNVDAAFGIFQNHKKNDCMVIGRSKIDDFDVGALMRSMGGGGHPGAGSALLKKVNPQAVKEWILELIQGNQQASVQISDLMSFPVFSVSANTSMAEVANMLRQKGCTGVPVVENEELVGVISRRDFKRIKKESQLKAPVKAFMKTNVLTAEAGKSPMQAARLMVKHDIGRLPVMEAGRMIGIVTRSDVMMFFYDLLPD
jgi:nanoRNase/pAp phosphatase (c-di-AMP/oligoRNAs hydrolase)/CBS domain-containing protein